MMQKRKKQKNPGSPDRGERAGLVGIGVNLLLALCKFVLGFLSGSVSVTADAANNLTDCGSCLLAILGFRLSARPADREHPFGHARYEYISALMIAIFTLLLGFSFLKESLQRIFTPLPTDYSPVVLILLAVTVAAKLLLGGYYRRVGKAMHSQTLRASAADSFSDAILTSVVLTGALIRRIASVEVDGYAGVIVAGVILFAGWKTIRETTGLLLGRAPDPGTVEQLRSLILAQDKVLGMHDLIVHSYGENRVFATAHAEIDARTDLLTAHSIADRIEEDVFSQTGIRMVIHVDPMVVDDPEQILLRKDVEKILRGISPELGYHDFRLDGKRCQLDLVVPEHFVLPDSELLSLVKREIGCLRPEIEPLIRLDRDFDGMDRKKE